MKTLLLFLGLFLCALSTYAKWEPGDDFKDPRDGQSYKTVKIGNQVWFAENLNYGKLINSVEAKVDLMKDNKIVEKFCYDNNEAKCKELGGLYEWSEALQWYKKENPQKPARGICPEGWHVPDNKEWEALFNQLGGKDAAGLQLFEGGSSGFEAAKCGYRCKMNGKFRPSAAGVEFFSYYWSSDTDGPQDAYFYEISPESINYFGKFENKQLGLCVRCILDAE